VKKPAEKVTIENHRSQGTVVRTLRTRGAGARPGSAGRRPVAERGGGGGGGGRGGAGGCGRRRAHDPGFNTVSWNLRYDGATHFRT
jgi:hypothetical protein